MPFITTPEHEAIFSAVRSSRSNLLIEAVAGSGKTTTLLELIKVLPIDPDSLVSPATTFLAFNKDIAETLKARVPRHVACSTFHSLGFRALRRVCPKIQVENLKVPKLLWSRLGREHPDFESCKKLVSLLKTQPPKADGRGTEIAQDLCDLYDISFQESSSIGVAVNTLAKSIEDTKTCDFDDMLFLPILLDAEFDQQDYVLVDESQDTNEIQLEILERLQKPWVSNQPDEQYSPTRFFFVGDRRQAIYGFRGASTDSLSRIARRFQTSAFPLSVTYRCPKAVVREVQKYL